MVQGSGWRRLEERFGIVLKVVACGALAGLFLLVAMIVISRFVPGLPSAGWTDELIELLFAWLIFAGAASLWRERGHFAVDLIGQMLAPSSLSRRAQHFFVELLSITFLLVFIWQSCVFIVGNATELSPIFTLPRYYWYGVMPIAGLIMIGYSLARVASLLRSPRDSFGPS